MTTQTSELFNNSVTHLATLKLPYPPSINSYYGRKRNGSVFIKKPGLEFRERVMEVLKPVFNNRDAYEGELQVWVEVYVPDRRRRDLDNISKALMDAITHSGVWEDDSQIADLRFVRGGMEKPGYVRLHIGELKE